MTPHDEDQQHQHRVDALRQLATTASGVLYVPPSPPRSIAPAPTSRHRPRWLIPLAVLLILTLLAGVGYVTLPFFHPSTASEPPIPDALTVDLTTAGISCPLSLSWAPDGGRVAVLGDVNPCPIGMNPTPALAILDTHTGKKVQAFDLNRILSAHSLSTLLIETSWTPDDKDIVVATGTATTLALLLLPLDGGQPRVFTSASSSTPGQPVWNVRTGQIVSRFTNPLPAALSYQWSAYGQISPGSAFPPGQHAPYSGRALDRHSFPFWQTGRIQSVRQPNDDNLNDPPALQTFTAAPAAEWSPDGQFVAFDPTWTGIVATLVASPALCRSMSQPDHCTLTALPLPDAAFATVLHAVQQPVAYTTTNSTHQGLRNWDSASIGWSPDGRTLATVLPGDQFADGEHIASTFVTLVSVVTGQPVKHFRYTCPTVTSLSNFSGCSGSSPLWSPTGQQIALLDASSVQLMLWKV